MVEYFCGDCYIVHIETESEKAQIIFDAKKDGRWSFTRALVYPLNKSSNKLVTDTPDDYTRFFGKYAELFVDAVKELEDYLKKEA